MVDVKSKTCENSTCDTRPVYNFKGLKTARFCTEHKLPNMVNVKSKTCEKCDVQCKFGLFGKQATCCSKCKTANMFFMPTKKCIEKKCNEYASHGLTINIRNYCHQR